jgi:DNA gyrase subunit A
MVLRTSASEISRLGRATQGVTIVNVATGDRVAALSVEDPEENGNGSTPTLIDPLS